MKKQNRNIKVLRVTSAYQTARVVQFLEAKRKKEKQLDKNKKLYGGGNDAA